jgi:hypothetical protein
MGFSIKRKRIMEPRLIIIDCISGRSVTIEKSPFVLGSSDSADFQIPRGTALSDVLLTVKAWLGGYEGTFGTNVAGRVDGVETNGFKCAPGQEKSLIVGDQVLILRCLPSGTEPLPTPFDPTWNVYDSLTEQWCGPYDLNNLRESVARRTEADWKGLILLPACAEKMGFFATDLKQSLGLTPRPDGLPPHGEPLDKETPQSQQTEAVNSEYGAFTCPICWFKFDPGDVMNIAVHGSLRGDEMLGEDQMQRFYATRFNDRGQALDAMGLAAPDLACPHCRRKLPPGFLDQPHHIFSIVGAPSSGKSYYLSVLVKILQSTLFQNFQITFRDADPSENVILTHMKTQLFSAGTPDEAFLAKTDLEGALYETLPRQGRKVRLPKPFIFRLSHPVAADNGFSVVFYDNAGEHFEPTSNSADSPGAQHIAVASGIFFLFDPLHNTEFRHKLRGVQDPQLTSHRLDQQDVILAETEARIKSLLGLDSNQRVNTPLAVMVGKHDTWSHLLGSEPLLPAITDGRISLPNLRANSSRVRQLLMDTCPAIVANAEAISSNVCYFGISPLGCSPVEFTDREGHLRIGPDPRQIDPRQVDHPTLWVLSQVAPDLFPSEP